MKPTWFFVIGLALSIIKANGWILVPGFCVAICWIFSIAYWIFYSIGKGFADGMNEKLEEELRRQYENHQTQR